MFTISNGNNEGKRPEDLQLTAPIPAKKNEAVSPRGNKIDATQRVSVSPSAPVRRTATPPQRSYQNAKKKRQDNQRKTLLIALSIVAALLLGGIIYVCSIIFAEPADNGLILNNVYAAGVNLGGKTAEEAKELLRDATENTYSKLPMTVTVHNTTITLEPSDIGANLDIDAVVQAAYNYGRTGTRAERQAAQLKSLTTSHVVSLIPYLNLNTAFIQGKVNELGDIYSSILTQPSYRVEGSRPDMNIPESEIDTSRIYQNLYITLGTPEYGLNTESLYEQILDAYNTNIFQVSGVITVVSPDQFDLAGLYNTLCVAPKDATLDEVTYEVTEGSFGYGFVMEQVKAQLLDTEYGQTIIVPLTFIRPDITASDLNDGLFETRLALLNLPLSSAEKDRIINIKLACRAINGTLGGLILRNGDVFSWNSVVGQPTENEGYKEISAYVGKIQQNVLGGGISQVASALYYCALKADLEIVERVGHTYAPNYIEAGLDAYVEYGVADLQFKNTTGRPVRIEATVNDNDTLQICIWGTANKDYSVDIIYEQAEIYQPGKLYNTMLPSNPGGYKDGDVLVAGITGYDIVTYRVYRYFDEEMEPVMNLIAETHYEKADEVVVKIQNGSDVPDEPDEDPKDEPSGDPDEKPTDQPGNEPDDDPNEENQGDGNEETEQ